MRVLVLGLNYAPEPIGIAVYTTGLCEALVRAGHDVTVISGKPYYPGWTVASDYRGGWACTIENGVSVLRCPLYVPRDPTGFKRIAHHISFALSALIPAVRAARGTRPDIVMAVAPSLMAAPVAALAARLSGAASWIHVQDFEVEAAVATDLVEERSPVIRIARAIESRILTMFGTASSIGPEMCRKLADKVKRTDVVEFRNWSDVSAKLPAPGIIDYRELWSIKTPHIALYSGNIANKQGIEIVLDAAVLLAGRHDLTFVICGQGPNRAMLEERAATTDNVRFHDLQPREALADLLALASVHLLPQKAGAADLVLPSKLTNMLASGRPVIATAAPGTGLAREVEGSGIVTPPGDAPAFAAAIETIIDDPVRYATASDHARRRASERWDRSAILGDIVTRLAATAAVRSK